MMHTLEESELYKYVCIATATCSNGGQYNQVMENIISRHPLSIMFSMFSM